MSSDLRAGDHIALEEGHSELLPLNPPDNWEKWNSDRDRILARPVGTASYLPEELRPFSRELDSNGRWVNVPEYGMVWSPAVIVSNDWAPYRSGRWIWKGNDYVWISYETWGWVPYHYGRWAVVSGIGWCWVPPVRGDIFWGPGYVGWYHSGDRIGWTPLAPGEKFYGHRSYDSNSINITSGSVSTATVIYKNRNARGGLSILLQNDFLRGRSVFQKPSSSAALSITVSLGSPRIQPVRETRMPLIKQIPPRAAPPAAQHHDTRELQTRFPRLVPDADKQRHLLPPVATPVPATAIKSAAPPSVPRQNDGDRPHMTPLPQTPAVTQTPPVSAPAIKPTAPPSVSRQSDSERPPHKTQSPLSGQPEIRTPPGSGVPANPGGVSGQTVKPQDPKPKKVWKVKTSEQGSEKEQKENKDRKGR